MNPAYTGRIVTAVETFEFDQFLDALESHLRWVCGHGF